MTQVQDEATQLLASVSQKLKGDYTNAVMDQWADSPFEWILTLRSSRQRGKVGEQLVSGWLATRGLDVKRSPDSDADRVIGGYRVEIKFSTLWQDGKYVFQQIRDQNYEYLVCLGISPYAAHAWVMNKSEIPFDKLKHQHAGEQGQDTWWFGVRPDAVPKWLNDFGGTLDDVLMRLGE